MKIRSDLIALALLIVPTLALAHGGHKHVSGTVVSADNTAIVVKTSTGNVSVPVSSTTRYYHGNDTKHPATASEVEIGMRVVVHLGADENAVEVHIPTVSTPGKR